MNRNSHLSRRCEQPTARRALTAGIALALASAGVARAQPASTVLRSRIDRWTGMHGSAGIPFVQVCLLDPETDSVIAEEATDSEGIFRFRDVHTGTYTVRVNRERPGCGFREFPVEVGPSPSDYTNIRPVLVHELEFFFDPLDHRPDTATVIIANYEYDNPPDWPVYVLAANDKREFRLPPLWYIGFPGWMREEDTPYEADLRRAEPREPEADAVRPWNSDEPGFDGGPWKGLATLNVQPGDSCIHAVLLNAAGMREVDSLTAAGATTLDSLSVGSRILTSVRLYKKD